MKKIMSLLVAVAMVAVMTSCAGTEEAPAQDQAAQQEAPAQEAPAQEEAPMQEEAAPAQGEEAAPAQGEAEQGE